MSLPIYNPYNSRNCMFGQKDIHTILRDHSCNHVVKDLNLFQNAMIHSSYVQRSEYTTPTGEPACLIEKPDNCIELFPESYERLEHLGDSVLGACVATYLSERFPDQQEGFLTNLRKEIVCNTMLGELAQLIRLNQFYVISKHNEDISNGRHNGKKLGDILESFIGALWIDCDYNFNTVYMFIISIIEKYIDIPKVLLNDTNYKDRLQKYCQTIFKHTPTYSMVSCQNGVYTMAVIGNDGQHIGSGSSTTKKQGAQFAAKAALTKYLAR